MGRVLYDRGEGCERQGEGSVQWQRLFSFPPSLQVAEHDGLIVPPPPVQVGEHDGCGPGCLASSGFSYDPESFMAARIGFYNFSWRDMGVPDLDKMMDIVQVGGGE